MARISNSKKTRCREYPQSQDGGTELFLPRSEAHLVSVMSRGAVSIKGISKRDRHADHIITNSVYFHLQSTGSGKRWSVELDSDTIHLINNLLKQVVDQEDTTILVATHDPLGEEYAELVYQLVDGKWVV